MNFFKEEQLFRVEIIKICPLPTVMDALLGRAYGYMPSPDSFTKGSFGCIPIGTKGWIIKIWGKEYFSPDKGQKGLDLFTNSDEADDCLILHSKVKEFYQILA